MKETYCDNCHAIAVLSIKTRSGRDTQGLPDHYYRRDYCRECAEPIREFLDEHGLAIWAAWLETPTLVEMPGRSSA
jgi:hypothetical protein